MPIALWYPIAISYLLTASYRVLGKMDVRGVHAS